MATKLNEKIYKNEIDEIKKVCDQMDTQLGWDAEYFTDKIRTSLRGLEISKKYADIDDDATYEVTREVNGDIDTAYVTGREAVEELLNRADSEDISYTVFKNVTDEF